MARQKSSKTCHHLIIIQASLLALAANYQFLALSLVEAKEFDWSDLGVSLSNSRLPVTNGSNNLRILVSPQRRMTKSYEFDYVGNGSQPTILSGQTGETSYVVPGSSSGQSGASHASAYSALSASLASLKSRLSSRGVTLTNVPSSLGDSGSSNQAASLYATSSGNGQSYLSDTQQQAQAQHQVQQQAQQQAHSHQPSYLSLTGTGGQQHSDSTGGYTSGQSMQNQSDGNKTIVLAIPAKINFLTDSHSSSGAQSSGAKQQPQAQYTFLNEQGQRDYQQGKQINVLSGQDGSTTTIDQATGQLISTSGIMSEPSGSSGEHQQQAGQQYVIVNQAPGQTVEQAAQQQQQPIYSTGIFSSAKPATIKYVSAYQSAPASVQVPAVQKVYTSNTAISPGEGQTIEDQLGSACPDTCNSADTRWRHHSVGKYKHCCSRSDQYDPSFDHPSAEKVHESSGKINLNDDAYYSYLYKKTRARRARNQLRASKRYQTRYQTLASSDDDSNNGASLAESDQTTMNESGGSGGKSSAGSSRYESPYMKYYRNGRPTSSSYGPVESPSSLADSGKDSPIQEQANNYGNRYTNKEKAHRRARSRDFDHPMNEPATHEQSGQQELDEHQHASQLGALTPAIGSSSGGYSSGYGSGVFSVESGRYPVPLSSHQPANQDSVASEEDVEQDGGDGNKGVSQMGESNYALEYPRSEAQTGSSAAAAHSEEELNDLPETSIIYSKYNARNSRSRQAAQLLSQHKVRSGVGRKLRGRRHQRKSKYQLTQQSSQTNGTDYESAQAGSGASHHEHGQQSGETVNQEEEFGGNGNYQRDSGKESEAPIEVEKEAALALANKYKASLNDSTVANLSRTTMHLKEILSILEKKTQAKNSSEPNSLVPTSTPAPVTTTSLYPLSSLFGSSYSSPALQSALANEYLASEYSLKSPYRYEPSAHSLASTHLTSAGALNHLPAAFSSDPLGSLSSFASVSNQFSLPTVSLPKAHHHLSLGSPSHLSGHNHVSGGHVQRKRRLNNGKNPHLRYQSMLLPKAHSFYPASSYGGLHGALKSSPFLGSAYYPSLQYPYWYPRSAAAAAAAAAVGSPSASMAATNAYPYRNLNKISPYSALLNGPLSSKLAAAAAASSTLYSDESRFAHGQQQPQTGAYDSLHHVASSLRPSTTMRLRPKSLVFQPHVLPIYTRHSILDVKA